jgi:hypothetical protein
MNILEGMTTSAARDILRKLGVNPDTEDLNKARKTLAKKYHPDRGGDPELMKDINAAVDTLLSSGKSSSFVDRENDPYRYEPPVSNPRKQPPIIIPKRGMHILLGTPFVTSTPYRDVYKPYEFHKVNNLRHALAEYQYFLEGYDLTTGDISSNSLPFGLEGGMVVNNGRKIALIVDRDVFKVYPDEQSDTTFNRRRKREKLNIATYPQKPESTWINGNKWKFLVKQAVSKLRKAGGIQGEFYPGSRDLVLMTIYWEAVYSSEETTDIVETVSQLVMDLGAEILDGTEDNMFIGMGLPEGSGEKDLGEMRIDVERTW